ncbi:beta-galactosidase [Niabella ginsenosidivorans]|uniref:Beta-galactosidase n=1 Tax=Niabella ginsenosidivorans TaxID=1176587 RepID=A0A1A9I2E4_9BACT|nr:sugar-binding domain-containing protein [Niabella ginsenosidivorans]ANH80744.1 beta-galactosidase [Niabella ginsenosidivorans]
MLRFVCLPVLLSLFLSVSGQGDPVKPIIQTKWASDVQPGNVLPEYPRPQLVRGNWMSLNGQWDYSIQPASAETAPVGFEGKILVPFPVESALSGVQKTVGKDRSLWYHRTIQLPASLSKGTVLLHFGAVDWQCSVFINGRKAGEHKGGYSAFTFDITPFLKKGKTQEIAVRVWDPSDDGPQPRGKQVKKPNGIWYTPVTGIWQTVWIEAVPDTYIASTKNTPDIDQKVIKVTTTVNSARPGDLVRVTALDGSVKMSEQQVAPGTEAVLPVENMKLWTPGSPFLYNLKVELLRKGKPIDAATSYFAMRKISMQKENGIQKMLLNNRFVFQYGPLDQGWWPDGLYTAPTDEALRFDIQTTKDMGFNMIRKHVKAEPARWYYHCDQLGMLVWQDMPSGDLGGNVWDSRPGQISGGNTDKDRSAESEAVYRTEWKEIMDNLYNFPCIVVWVPFNEAWGQFKTKEITEWTMQYDPSRLVNSASGGNFFPVGHIMDLHHYPDPAMPDPRIFGSERILVLGEFGGLGLPLEGHTWQAKNNWGYQTFKNQDELKNRYSELVSHLARLIPLGLSAAVYTQTTDVEVETNGLMTYDRKVYKIDPKVLHEIHQQLYKQ